MLGSPENNKEILSTNDMSMHEKQTAKKQKAGLSLAKKAQKNGEDPDDFDIEEIARELNI